LLLSLLLSACTTAGLQTLLHGVTISRGGKAGDHITSAECIEPEEAAKWVAIAWPILLQQTAAQGYATDTQVREVGTREPLGLKVCLVAEPQQCCLGSFCAAPCSHGKCARKAGCASSNHIWVSKLWPPQCTSDAGEYNRRCGPAEATHDWRGSLVHELGNVVRLRLLPAEGYDATSTTRFFAPGGPVSATYDAIRSAL
jgi:hypothetical protein